MALVLATTCGCVRHYVITMTNGGQITTRSKPHLKGNKYVFKDVHGSESSLPAGRVSEIAPASMVRQEKEPFNPGPLK